MSRLTFTTISLAVLTAITANADQQRWQTTDDYPANRQTQKNQRESYFGLNGTKFFHIPNARNAAVKQRAEWMNELQVYWDRCDLWWHVVNPEPGKFDWSRPDMIFDQLEQWGIQYYPILCYGAAWFDEGRTAPLNEEEMRQFAEYAYQTVKRYRGRAPHWSLWNEPNIENFWKPSPDGAAYAKLMQIVYPKFKAADPQAKLCAPAIAPLGAWDRQFVERMYQAGAKDYFDIFDYHYYHQHAPDQIVPAELDEIKAVMLRYGDQDKPIIVTEAGVSSLAVTDSKLHAAYVVRTQLLALAHGVKRFYYFDLQNWQDDRTEWDTQLGLVKADGTPKPAFHAYKTLVAQIDTHPIIGPLDDRNTDVKQILFYDDHEQQFVIAAWSVGEPLEHQFLTRRDAQVIGPTGERVPVAATTRPDGIASISVKLDDQPRYIRGVARDIYAPQAGVRWSHRLVEIAPGESLPFHLHVDPRLDGEAKIRDVDLPAGLQWDREQKRLTAAADAAPGNHKISAVVEYRSGRNDGAEPMASRLTCNASIRVVPAVDLALHPYLSDGVLKLAATVTAQQARSDADALELVRVVADDEQVMHQQKVGDLQTRAPRDLDLDVDAAALLNAEPQAAWFARYAGRTSDAFRVHPAAVLERPPVIDGDLSDWRGQPGFRIDSREQLFHSGDGMWSPADASAVCWIAFDADAAYFAADVTDNDPMVNPGRPVDMWRGDSLEVFVGVCGPTRRSIINKACEFQIGLGPRVGDDNAPTAFWFHHDQVLTTATVSAKRTENGYTIEAKIPYAAVGAESGAAVQPGAIFALDVNLNDADTDDFAPAGVNRGRRLAWSGGGTNWINPSHYGVGLLVKSDFIGASEAEQD